MSLHRLARAARPIVAASLLLLSACGGGGGGGGGGTTAGGTGGAGGTGSGPTNVSMVAINLANQNAVAADALGNLTNGSPALTGTLLLTGVQVDRASAAPRIPFLADVIRRFAGMAPAQPGLAAGAAVNQSTACSQGGSLAFTGTIADANQFTSGDTMTLTATQCQETVDNAPVTMNGSMHMYMLGGMIGTNVFSVTIQVTFTGFAVQSNGTTVTTNGDMLLDWEYTGGQQSMEASGTSLTASAVSSGGTRFETWNNYDQRIQLTSGGAGYELIGTVFTLNPAFGPDPVAYQLTGSISVDAASGAFASGFVTVDGANSRLQFGVSTPNAFVLVLDANADGTPDNETDVLLADLQSVL